MTQEQKDLLLKDLCARLPYDVKFPITWPDPITSEPIETIGTISDINRYGIVSFVWDYEVQEILEKNNLHIQDVKPYLFPIASMTEEQKNSFPFSYSFLEALIDGGVYFDEDECITLNDMIYVIQWCYKNHFDIHGLIPMGLAINATGLNIY